jgi:hypothetical protein
MTNAILLPVGLLLIASYPAEVLWARFRARRSR